MRGLASQGWHRFGMGFAALAQMAERAHGKRKVVSSILTGGSVGFLGDVAQWPELVPSKHQMRVRFPSSPLGTELANEAHTAERRSRKAEVVGSTPTVGSSRGRQGQAIPMNGWM